MVVVADIAMARRLLSSKSEWVAMLVGFAVLAGMGNGALAGVVCGVGGYGQWDFGWLVCGVGGTGDGTLYNYMA
jgi:hypothetical protein